MAKKTKREQASKNISDFKRKFDKQDQIRLKKIKEACKVLGVKSIKI